MQLLHIWILREYLAHDMRPEKPVSFKLDDDRLFDDFVFLCFFVGNDFLPHMPTLEIREGAIDLMMTLYKQMLPVMGGYMCEGGNANLMRVEQMMLAVAEHEDAIFQKRARQEVQVHQSNSPTVQQSNGPTVQQSN
eukprot:994722-Prorocentrum_minimum.AAC.2